MDHDVAVEKGCPEKSVGGAWRHRRDKAGYVKENGSKSKGFGAG